VELPGGVSVYRLSLAQREGSPAVDSAEGDSAEGDSAEGDSAEVDRAGGDSAVPDSTAGADKPTPVHRGGARCGKLVFRPQKPPAK
jgi:tRNA(Ile)-lysidine synthase